MAERKEDQATYEWLKADSGMKKGKQKRLPKALGDKMVELKIVKKVEDGKAEK